LIIRHFQTKQQLTGGISPEQGLWGLAMSGLILYTIFSEMMRDITTKLWGFSNESIVSTRESF
jgi:hypothetical protein